LSHNSIFKEQRVFPPRNLLFCASAPAEDDNSTPRWFFFSKKPAFQRNSLNRGEEFTESPQPVKWLFSFDALRTHSH